MHARVPFLVALLILFLTLCEGLVVGLVGVGVSQARLPSQSFSQAQAQINNKRQGQGGRRLLVQSLHSGKLSSAEVQGGKL